MKFTALRSSLLTALIIISGLFFYGCSDSQSTSGVNTTLTSSSSSPTQAYQDLYEAVKSGEIERIKAQMSSKTLELAAMTAARYQQPVEKVLANAFTTTVKAEALPTVREERILESMGAVEVWDTETSSWQDVPFIYEDGGWKLAFGDLLAGNWKSPGEGRAARERREANTSLPSPTDGLKPMPSISEGLKKMEESNRNTNAAANTGNTTSETNKQN